jgi:hypothetical protein
VVGPWRTTPVAACRIGRFKLIEFFESGDLELYDLSSDPSEQSNLVEEFPDLTKKMHARMVQWRMEVGALLPSPLSDVPSGVETIPGPDSTSKPEQSL